MYARMYKKKRINGNKIKVSCVSGRAIRRSQLIPIWLGADRASALLAGLKKRLAAFSKKYPDLCQLEKPEHLGGVSYLIDKSRLSIRLQLPYSEEHRQKASQYARQNGFNGKTK